MPVLYHERQIAALCGQHCLNNLLQGPYWTEVGLAEIAHELDAQERALMLSEGVTADARRFMSEASGNVDESGNFSIQVIGLIGSMQRAIFEIACLRRSSHLMTSCWLSAARVSPVGPGRGAQTLAWAHSGGHTH